MKIGSALIGGFVRIQLAPRAVIVLATLGIGFCKPALAGVLVGESYVVQTPNGFTLGQLTNAGQPNGTPPSSVGFTGAYSSGAASTSTINVIPAGLNSTATGYSGATGGAVQLNVSNNSVGSASTPDSRVTTRGLSYTSGSTYYYSALIQSASTTALNAAEGAYVEFSNNSPTNYNDPLGASGDRGFLVGLNGDGTHNSIVVKTTDGTNNSLVGHTVLSSLAANNQLNLVILKVDVNANGTTDNFTVYVNPTNVSTEALAASTAANAANETFTADALTNNGDITRLGYELFNNGATGPNVVADEPRIGTSFADVVSGVPEPTSMGVVVMAGLTLLARRRRAATYHR